MTPQARACVDLVLKHEGGYSDAPTDPGNWAGGKVGAGELKGTMRGIAASAHPDLDIRNLTLEQCEAIYAADYWAPIRGDALPMPLAMVTLDAAVMSGIHRAACWLQEAVGVTRDGSIGPATIGAAKACDLAQAVRAACMRRLQFLRTLEIWETFGDGWGARVADTEKAALAAIGAKA